MTFMNETGSIHLQFEFTVVIFAVFFFPFPSIWVKFNMIQVIIYTVHEEEKSLLCLYHLFLNQLVNFSVCVCV